VIGNDGVFSEVTVSVEPPVTTELTVTPAARATVAALVGASPRDLTFTSGATEANNLAILGHAQGRIKGGHHVKYPQDSRFADLLVTLFDRNNIPVEKLGDSGGILSEV